jgi:hypothetical protein
VYVVNRIELHSQAGTLYHLDGYRRPLLRFEMLKVRDVMRPVAGQLRSVLHERLHVRPVLAPAQAVAALARPAPVPIFRPVTRSAAAAAAAPPAVGLEPGPLPIPPAARADVERTERTRRPPPPIFRRVTRSQT